jgi:flavodoxin/ferredoxin
MHRALILYFSITGTTRKIADAIASGLHRSGWQSDLRQITDDTELDLQGYDMLGVGYPTHWFRPPVPVRRLLQRLPQLDGMPAFVFVSFGVEPGDAGNEVRRLLSRKGAWEVGYNRRHGADYHIAYLREGYFFSPHAPSEEDLAWAKRFGETVGARAVAGSARYEPPAEDPAPVPVYRVERLLASPPLTKAVFSRLFAVDPQKCTACGLCMTQCPEENIASDASGKPRWGRECLLCTTCERICPEDGISSPVDWRIMRPLVRYNIRRAIRDPAVDYTRVRHQRGRVMEV